MDERFLLLKKKFDRLAHSGAGKAHNGQEAVKAGSAPGLHPVLPDDWQQAADFVYTRTCTISNPLDPGLFAASLLNPAGFQPGQITFFDVETTGLSGGAGNIIFLIGLGTVSGKTMTVEQIFLSDFPGENDFLTLLESRLDPARLFVSYNGKGFDSHVLASRYLMNRKEIALPHQLDLLYLTRRLWKSTLGSCSLGDIERSILGVERTCDIPGYLVPGVYFSFLRTGNTGELVKVFEHNYQDICSLALLLQKQLLIFAGREMDEFIDYHSLGAYFLENAKEKGVLLLEKSAREGNPLSGKTLSLYYKKNRDWAEAEEIWQCMYRQNRSRFAAIELAKYYEHRERKYEAALEWVKKVWDSNLPLAREEKEELKKRRNRILQKIKKGTCG